MRERSPDRAVVALSATQHRVVTGAQLTAAGLGPRHVAHRVAVGWLRRLHRGVYAVGPVDADSRDTHLVAAVYACGEGALLSHQSAAEVWGLLKPAGGDIHVTVVGRNPGKSPGVRLHRATALNPRDVRTRRGIALTSPARTALDIAGSLEGAELERAMATARVEHLARDRDLLATLESYPTHPAAARLKAVLRRVGGPALTRSEAERLMLTLMRSARLPVPRTNARVEAYEVDFLWPAQRLVVEVDGFAYHGDRAAFERDRDRDAALVAVGYRVIRVTWRQLVEEPLLVVSRIAQALASAPAPLA